MFCSTDSSPTSSDELKWLKSDMNQVKDELAHARSNTNDRFFSMEMTNSILRHRVERIDNQVGDVTTKIASVSRMIFSPDNVIVDLY